MPSSDRLGLSQCRTHWWLLALNLPKWKSKPFGSWEEEIHMVHFLNHHPQMGQAAARFLFIQMILIFWVSLTPTLLQIWSPENKHSFPLPWQGSSTPLSLYSNITCWIKACCLFVATASIFPFLTQLHTSYTIWSLQQILRGQFTGEKTLLKICLTVTRSRPSSSISWFLTRHPQQNPRGKFLQKCTGQGFSSITPDAGSLGWTQQVYFEKLF